MLYGLRLPTRALAVILQLFVPFLLIQTLAGISFHFE
jgi:hypothetical protein